MLADRRFVEIGQNLHADSDHRKSKASKAMRLTENRPVNGKVVAK